MFVLPRRLSLVVLVAIALLRRCAAFVVMRRPTKQRLVVVLNGRSLRNKQADLLRKMQQAKQQKQQDGDEAVASDGASLDDEVETKEFERLLAQSPIPKQVESEGRTTPRQPRGSVPSNLYPSRKKNQKRKPPKRPEDDETHALDTPVQEGERAHRRHFERLLTIPGGYPLGPIAAAQLVPWVPPYLTSNLIVLADPRRNSNDWRTALQYVESSLSSIETTIKVVGVTAETPDKTSSWLQRSGVDLDVYSDPALEWMQMYADTGNRWSLSLLVFDDRGTLVKVYRRIEPSEACKIIFSRYGEKNGDWSN